MTGEQTGTRIKRRPRSGAAILSDVASPAHLRVDLWNRVRDGVDAITRAPSRRRELEGHLRRLEEVERLFAYPGAARIERVRRLYRAGDLPQLRALIDELVDRLSEEGDRAALTVSDDGASSSQTARYFTVLLVDTMPPERLRTLRHNLRELRERGSGDLVYEVVRVASFEEAWLAVMC